MPAQEITKDYDSEPVWYCAKCYSLKIGHEDCLDTDYCMDCGCSDILTSSIEEWEKLYNNRYGHPHVIKNKEAKYTFLKNASINELKNFVFNSPSWHDIIYEMYPSFPGGLGKADSCILFFDKVVNSNRIEDLKKILKKYYNG